MPAESDNGQTQSRRFATFITRTCFATLALLTLALILRAWGLEVAYYDEYDNFGNALVLLGDPLPSYFTARAPLAVLAQLPAMALVHAGLTERSLQLPHLIALAITLAGLALSFRFIRLGHSSPAAATALLILACNRVVLHYAPFAENTGTSLLALALALPLIAAARAHPTGGRLALAAFGIALAGLARSNFLALGPITVIYWLLYPKLCTDENRRQSFDFRALVTLGLLSLLMWNGTYVLLDLVRGGFGSDFSLLAGFEHSLSLVGTATNPTQSEILSADALFYLQVLPLISGWPAVLLALIGMVMASRRRTGLDLLVILTAPILFVLISRFPWYECRYLIALAPLMAYLAAPPLQWLIESVTRPEASKRSFALISLLLIGAGTLHTASLEIRRWSDPFFRRPVAHELAAFIEQRRGTEGRVFWRGPLHAFYPAGHTLHQDDPYYSIFHLSSKGLSYLLEQPVIPRFQLNQFRDGDVSVWNTNPLITTRNLPEKPSPLTVLSFSQVARTTADPSAEGIDLREEGEQVAVSSRRKITAVTLTKTDGSKQTRHLSRPVTSIRLPNGLAAYEFLVYEVALFDAGPHSAHPSREP